ncbi:MAG: biosynthetic arginine decarboxylase [Limnospira sp. PMC 1291.21]|uniref:Biosynthetic arginine decarboxylase n=3 Tax=Limnospira TaxID=2596745 RepID=A0A9P1P0Q7_9CYAN|nr:MULTISPECIES: biosynthetic arginine decarboxylase [Limnospira]EKD09436.1 arginine decarboxylase [Arthrospira platensis C1]MBD2668167.1 biosynthetic arginine decarboxylase [Arthrospira platensis FACHB-439]MDC0838418.1 biosynthetic arginine decarboxylase [Limnoraphis robusta]MDY7051444.1 biosynthetic arginine decarboxylase [Limnospira fusiformis LS22]QJB24788.1 biosynthetic arginine decarboxylase [Limnospira fusiformis SAG 85.79]RAQ39815.1 biosynthetic arginine decarboxylase [Arthrospira sp.
MKLQPLTPSASDSVSDHGVSDQMGTWTIEDSEKLYHIQGWGEPYFSINAAGHITVSPQGDRGGSIDLYELVESLKKRNLGLPLLIRFPDILEDRIERLNACFSKAIARYNYPGVYRGVYPVKCNQERHLIEDLVRFGEPYQLGLEAGSKPELLIALACLTTPGALLICNGYKDRQYIETAMLAQRLGRKTIVVMEQLEEVELAIAASQNLGIQPILGVRAKLGSRGVGRWGGSTGDRAKFGLTIPEIIQVCDRLQGLGMLDCLQLLHFHIGSQISSISAIKDAIREASQIYVELAKLGANMQYLDVGGGLGVDYDGSKTNAPASKNYNMQNYANDIVAEVKEACEQGKIDAPVLISESGRAIASHQSILVFDILGSSEPSTANPPNINDDDHLLLRNLAETYQSINPDNYQEAYHDAIQFKGEAISVFNFGYLNLRDRAKAEQLYWACCHKIREIIRDLEIIPDDLKSIEQIMASIYYVNLSVFKSAPDSWAIDQLFPILPIHRLNEEPTQRATLADLTCDSDGKIDRFINWGDSKPILELHPLTPSQPYYLGMFLAGAYQEIMGNLHNLFGDTHVVHIQLNPQGYQVEYVIKGDTMNEVLGYVQYDSEDLVESIRRQTEKALQSQKITIEESQLLLQNYERSLTQYTYLTSH